uniref:Uncharacterized protein n=1 Tax=Candidatus Kentrum sp. LFY TaxID=2126342 RepID=A0A450UE77_9GAMM|nr:MAG: hypothetical protein BECKLFY1418A_GA0070994_101333 [Candidatus Kentron sp. LFY]
MRRRGGGHDRGREPDGKRVLRVRVHNRPPPPRRFFRCGLAFTNEWKEVKVAMDVAERLFTEPMLEVETGERRGQRDRDD